MFVTVQIPIADARPFLGSETARLRVPGWPAPQVDAEFVRSVGPVRERRLGGLSPWLGEGYYASAARAIRFPAGFAEWPRHGRDTTRLHCLFRKFFSDGRAVSRVEVGFGPRNRHTEASALRPQELLGVLASCLGVPVEIPRQDGALAECELANSGPALARHLLRSTTLSADLGVTASWWMRSLRPMAVATLHSTEMDQVPKVAKRVELTPAGSVTYYMVVGHDGVTVPVWLLPWERSEERDQVRRIRMHLYRLHGEREVLKWMLSAAAQGRLANASSPTAWDSLQRYLNDTLGLLRRGAVYGVDATPELKAALGLGDLVNPGDREALLAQLDGMRGNVFRKVENVPAGQRSQPLVYIGKQIVVTQSSGKVQVEDNSVSVGDIHGSLHGAVGSNINITESFQQIEGSTASEEAKEALKVLVEAVEQMKGELGAGEQATAARDLEALVGEATAPAPRRGILEALGDGLVQTAKSVGEVGLPVVRVVTQLLALFG